MIQGSINQMIGSLSRLTGKLGGASKQDDEDNTKDYIKSLEEGARDMSRDVKAVGNAHAAQAIQRAYEQANNNNVKNYITPGDIRREIEAKEAAEKAEAAAKGIAERDLGL